MLANVASIPRGPRHVQEAVEAVEFILDEEDFVFFHIDPMCFLPTPHLKHPAISLVIAIVTTPK